MYRKVIGIDEVGRGCWAGPLVVGAVILSIPIEGLKDSKLLSKKQREKLSLTINVSANFVGLGWVSSSEIDDMGLTKATTLACRRAIKNAPLDIPIIIDGKINYLPEFENCSPLINADTLVPAVSAASIIAKVARDDYMSKQSDIYPKYGFSTNVGYGTKSHLNAIQTHGLTPLHRWSYSPIKKILEAYET